VEALYDAGVRFLVVGGFAVHFYWPDRIPGDLDLWFASTSDNSARAAVGLGRALNTSVDPTLFTRPRAHLALKMHGVYLLMLDDADFEMEWGKASRAKIGSREGRIVAVSTLTALKEKAREQKDLWSALSKVGQS